jgi:AcrR family transcriptional regulator
LARPRSDDKRNAILTAATRIFAERGLSAPTSAISKAAGVAEGTLFTYYSSKDELVNVLYREIKLELADAMMSGFPRRLNVRSRLQHVWDQFLDWGVKNPLQQRALKQIEVWSGLTAASKKAGSAPFVEIEAMAEEAVEQRVIEDLPRDFIRLMMSAMVEATLECMRQQPKQAAAYRRSGFEMLWKGLKRGG